MSAEQTGISGYGMAYAEVYARLHASKGWDWAAEARDIAAQVQRSGHHATSLLDVACGTGEHLAAFSTLFAEVAGVEVSSSVRAVANHHYPGLPIYQGDMRDFTLATRFDVVTCLSYAIAYMPSPSELDRAVARMARHLTPGGMLILEPWWGPKEFIDGYVSATISRDAESVVTRLSHSRRVGDTCMMTVRVTVADRDQLDHFTEIERLTLFTYDDYVNALRAAGFGQITLDPSPRHGRRRLTGVLERSG